MKVEFGQTSTDARIVLELLVQSLIDLEGEREFSPCEIQLAEFSCCLGCTLGIRSLQAEVSVESEEFFTVFAMLDQFLQERSCPRFVAILLEMLSELDPSEQSFFTSTMSCEQIQISLMDDPVARIDFENPLVDADRFLDAELANALLGKLVVKTERFSGAAHALECLGEAMSEIEVVQS